MSSPSRRMSGALSSGGPSRSILQQLLEEINGPDSTPILSPDERTPQPMPGSRSGSISRAHHTPSVWVNGGSAAEDARQKLRALDEARQRKQSQNKLSATPDS